MAKKGKTSVKSKSKSVVKKKSAARSISSKKSANTSKSKTTKKMVQVKHKKKALAKETPDLSAPSSLEIGELPELPNFEGFTKNDSVQAPAALLDATPISSTSTEKQKLWWLSWLMPGKKQPIVDAQIAEIPSPESTISDVSSQPALTEMPDLKSANADTFLDAHAESSDALPLKETKAQKLAKKKAEKQAKTQEEHIARAYDEVDTLKTRLDEEMRDRQSAIEESHDRLKGKEAELEKWHADLETREKEVVKNEKEFERIKKLEAQVEDKQITLKYKEDEIEDLKNKLAEKELELTQKEGELKELGARLEQVQSAKQQSEPQTMQVSDDYHKLAKKHGHTVHHKSHPRAVLSKVTASVETPTKRDIRAMLLKAYDQLSANDMAALQVTYANIRDSYSRMIATTGPDEQLYKDILDLFNDIKLAVVQRN